MARSGSTLARRLAVAGLAIIALLLVLLAVCAAVILRVPEPSLEGVGNRPRDLARLSSGKSDFSFAVLGDTQKGLGSLRKMGSLLQDVDFAVHCGDMVADNDEGHWKLFFRYLGVRPVVAAAGNHDIKRGYENFRRYFGPAEFSFTRGPCRFIFVESVRRQDPFSADWLEDELRGATEPNLLVFMHVPPFDYRREDFVMREGWEPFFELLRKYKVRYVFCGHDHAYRRQERGGTVIISNGQGGDYDAGAIGTKVCATRVTVSGGAVRDEAVTADPSHGLWSNLEHMALGHVWMSYRDKPVLCWGGTVLLAFAGAGLVWFLRRARGERGETPEA